MTHLEHDRCSELLSGYLRKELDAADESWVADHLEGCTECSAELRALSQLAALPVERPTDIERASLHRRLADAIAVEEELEAPPIVGQSRPIGARVVQWLGAAALIALLGVGITTLGGGLGSSDEETAGDAGGGGDRAGEESSQEAPRSEPFESGAGRSQRSRAKSGGVGSGGGAGTDSGTTFDTDLSAKVGPRLYPGGQTFSAGALRRWGASNLELVLFAEAYSVEDVNGIQNDYLEELVGDVRRQRSADDASTFEECARPVIQQRESAVPAYVAFGRYGRRKAVVGGFAWSRADEGALNRYMLWVWPAGRCDAVLDYREGRIRPSP